MEKGFSDFEVSEVSGIPRAGPSSQHQSSYFVNISIYQKIWVVW